MRIELTDNAMLMIFLTIALHEMPQKSFTKLSLILDRIKEHLMRIKLTGSTLLV